MNIERIKDTIAVTIMRLVIIVAVVGLGAGLVVRAIAAPMVAATVTGCVLIATAIGWAIKHIDNECLHIWRWNR